MKRLYRTIFSLLCLSFVPTTVFAGPEDLVGAKPDLISYIQGNTSQTRHISIPKNKAAIVRLPRASKDVIVADPEMLDVVVRNPREIYIFAKKTGMTNAFFFDEAGEQIVNIEVNIGLDVKELERIFSQQMPESRIKVASMGDTIILSGSVNNSAYAKVARDIARRLVDSPEKVINNIGIAGQEQVMIKVKVAEIQRSILKQLGIDWNTAFNIGKFSAGFGLANGFGINGAPPSGLASKGLGDHAITNTIGSLPAFSSPASIASYLDMLTESSASLAEARDGAIAQIDSLLQDDIPDATQQSVIDTLNLRANRANEQIAQNNRELITVQNNQYKTGNRTAGYRDNHFSTDALLKALEAHSLVKTLAEPNLTALSGESAKFLAGGELPFVVPQSLGQSTVEYKPYGIGLAFTPMILNESRISLKISTEVSEIGSNVGSYPSLEVRRAETTVEMPSGGSLIMAGLIREDSRRAIDSAPGVKDVPILGPLFRSNDFKSRESELAILVTPYLVEPTHEKNLSLPTDGYVNPSDLDMYVDGKLTGTYNPGEDGKSLASKWFGDSKDVKKSEATLSNDHILE